MWYSLRYFITPVSRWLNLSILVLCACSEPVHPGPGLRDDDIHVRTDEIMQSAWSKPVETERALQYHCDQENRESAYFCYNYGVFLFQRGKRSEAIKAFEKSVKLNPRFGEAVYAVSLLSNSALPEPYDCWEKALVAGGNSNAAKAREHLLNCKKAGMLTRELLLNTKEFETIRNREEFIELLSSLPSAAIRNLETIHRIRSQEDPVFALEREQNRHWQIEAEYKNLLLSINSGGQVADALQLWLKKLRAFNSRDLVRLSVVFAAQDPQLKSIHGSPEWKRFRRGVGEVSNIPEVWWSKVEK